MIVVVFAMAGRGHFNRMLPVIDGLSRAGAETYVFTDGACREDVARAGGRFVDLFAEHTVDEADAVSIPVPCRFVSFAGLFGDAIVKAAAALEPSLVVHDTFAVIGRVVAHHLGVPRVNVCAGHNSAPSLTLESLRHDPRVRVADVCWAASERLREQHGIPDASPFSYVTGISSDLNLYCEPPQFLHADERKPFEPVAFFGSLWLGEAESDEVSRAVGPASASPWIAAAGRAPVRLYVSFGTVIWRYYQREAQAVLDALGEALVERTDIDAIVSLGGAGAYEPARTLPGNVQVEHYVDQWQVLRGASVALIHQGLNSTHEAIYQRVPMISYPFFGDQPGLAARTQELGLAVPLVNALRGVVSAEDIRAALDRVEVSRAVMMERLTYAREWEIETMRARPAVVERMIALGR